MKKIVSLSAVVLIIMLLLAPGCTRAPSPTPSEPTVDVIIASHRDNTGPIALAVEPLWAAYDHYMKWKQETDPIPGVRIVNIWEDTAYSADRYLPAYMRFQDAGAVLQINTSSTANSVYGEIARRDRVPIITPGCGYIYGFFPEDVYEKGPSYLFFDRPPYGDFFAAVAIAFMEKWNEAGYTEKPRAMFITWDTPFGRGPIELGTPWAEEYGFDMLPAQLFPTGATELISQLRVARDLGANLIYMNAMEWQFSMLVKDATRLGIEFGIGPGKMQLACGSEAHTNAYLDLVGEAGEGTWASSSFANWDEDLPGVELAKALQMKYWGELREKHHYFMGLAYGILAWHLIETAAQQYGPENITREVIYELLTQLEDFDMMGIVPNFSYGEYERRPFRTWRVHEVRGGEFYKIADVELPWLTPSWEQTGLPGWRPEK